MKHKQHFLVLDGMRGIAAIAVVIYHYTQRTDFELFKSATLAVDFFFILSGFVIMYSYGERLRNGMSPYSYTLKRIIRLYPMFIIGIVIGSVILYTKIVSGDHVYDISEFKAGTILNSFFIPYMNNGGSFEHGVMAAPLFIANVSMWSLFYEMLASISFIWLVGRSKLSLLILCALNFIGLLAYGVYGFQDLTPHQLYLVGGWGSENIMDGFFRAMFGFIAGMIIYENLEHLKNTKLYYYLSKIPYPQYFIYLSLIVIFSLHHTLRGFLSLAIIAFFGPVLVYWGAINQLKNSTDIKISTYLGALSYPLYCLHMPVLSAVNLLASEASQPEKEIIAFILSILVSWIFLKYYDEPVRGYLNKISSRFSQKQRA